MTGLINKTKLRKFILDYAAGRRAHKFTRIAPCVYEEMESAVREKCRLLVHRQPSKGRTIR